MSDHLSKNLFASSLIDPVRKDNSATLSFLPSARRLLSALTLGALALAPSATAEDLCDPCVVHVPLGTIASPINLLGWLAPSDASSILVSRAPDHGQWDPAFSINDQVSNGAYLPNETSFWQVGVDQVVFNPIDADGNPLGMKTLVLVASNPEGVLFNSVDFTQLGGLGNLGSNWTVFGIHSHENPGAPVRSTGQPLIDVGSAGMAILATSGIERFVEDPTVITPIDDAGSGQQVPTIGGTGGRVVAAANAEPGFNLPTSWFEVTLLNLDGLLMVEMRIRDDGTGLPEAEARARLAEYAFCEDDGSPCTAELATKWRPVDPNGGHEIRVQLSERSVANSLRPQWSLVSRIIDRSTGIPADVQEIWPGTPVIPSSLLARVGAVLTGYCDDGGAAGDCGVVITIQEFEHEVYRYEQNHSVFYTDFEAPLGTAAGSPMASDIVYYEGADAHEVTPSGLQNNGSQQRVLSIDLLAMEPNSAGSGYTPPVNAPDRSGFILYQPNSEEEVMIRANFATTISGSQYPQWASMRILEIGRSEAQHGVGPLEVLMRVNGQFEREVYMRVYANGQVLNTPWIATGDDFDIAVRWRRDTSGGMTPNGYAALSVNEQTHTFEDLDNWQTGEYVAIGASRLNLPYLPITSEMILVVDDVAVAYEDLLP